MMRFLALVLGVFLLSGCGGKVKLPKTHPVKGKVLDAAGAPLKGGQINFESTTDKAVSVSSPIEPDGSFSLKTFRNKMEAPGAAEGEYKVIIQPPIVEGNVPPPPVTLPNTVKVEAKDNNLELKLP